jgi:hypothetical protein
VPESMKLLDRPAVTVLADRPAFDRLARAISVEKGLDYISSIELFQDGIERFTPRNAVTTGKVLEAIGVEKAEPTTKLLELHDGRVRALETAMPEALDGTRIVNGKVLITPDVETAPWLADPVERERRLHRIRAARVDGAFAGDNGRKAFAKADRDAVDTGWDMVATAEAENAVRQAQAQARAEAARLQAPLDQTQALRQEKLKLSAEVKSLDRSVEDLERQSREEKRAGRPDALIRHKIGQQLSAQREASKQLEQISENPRIELDSIPALRFVAERSEPAAKLLEQESSRASVRQLQAQINAAEAHVRRHPEVPFYEALNMAEQGKIMLAQDEPRMIQGPLVGPVTLD